jgi:hypothetical protein
MHLQHLNSEDMIARKGKPRKYWEQNSQERQPVHDFQNRTARTRLPGNYSLERSSKTG